MRKTIMLVTAVAAATIVLSSSVAFAQRPGPGRGGARIGAPGPANAGRIGPLGQNRRPARRLAAMGRQLELTADQRAKIKTIMQGFRNDAAPFAREMRAVRAERRAARRSGTPDAASLAELRAKATSARSKIADLRAATRPGVLEVLTPAQQEKLQAIRRGRNR